LSAWTAGGTMVLPSASRNDNDDDLVTGNSSGGDHDESCLEHPASHCGMCSTITIPKKGTRRNRLL